MVDIRNIKQRRILVIGDVMLDKYFVGDIKRISPEAPVPVFRKKSERSVLGGAANVAANLVAAGQSVSMMSIIADDENGRTLLRYFKDLGIDASLVENLRKNTTVKTRFLANNNQQVLRLDVEDTYEISKDECNLLLGKLSKVVDNFDLILLSDYLKGLLSYDFTQGVLNISKENNIPAIIDVKDLRINKYSGAYLLKPNLKEVRDLTNMPAETDGEIIAASQALRERCMCQYVLTTCGAQGMVLVSENDNYFIPTVGHDVYDVSGAGDTTIAYLATCMANKMPMHDCVDIANTAAGIQVSKLGTSSVYMSEVKAALADDSIDSSHKILGREELVAFRKNYADKKIVFTNGCFDILHVGHKRYLQKAAELGDLLIIGVNSDASVKRLKGPERPINNENDRAEMVAALGFVDYVVVFDEDTPYELIRQIQPDVLVKGGDYKPDQVVGKDLVEKRGGKLVLIPFVDGKSTTNIINKIKK